LVTKIGFVYVGIRPYALDKLVLRDERPWSFQQCSEKLEPAAPQPDLLPISQKPAARVKAERTERNLYIEHVNSSTHMPKFREERMHYSTLGWCS
jgi:hypothetical protein